MCIGWPLRTRRHSPLSVRRRPVASLIRLAARARLLSTARGDRGGPLSGWPAARVCRAAGPAPALRRIIQPLSDGLFRYPASDHSACVCLSTQQVLLSWHYYQGTGRQRSPAGLRFQWPTAPGTAARRRLHRRAGAVHRAADLVLRPPAAGDARQCPLGSPALIGAIVIVSE
jgi:hypothetical protein